jgi:hypothetical protein
MIKNFLKHLKSIKELALSLECVIENDAIDYIAKSDGVAVPLIKLLSEDGRDNKKVRQFFISNKTSIKATTRLVKLKDIVALFIITKDVKLKISFDLKNLVHVQLLLGVFLGSRLVLQEINLGFEYNKVFDSPTKIENADQSFLNVLLCKAMLPYYRKSYPKLNDEEILLLLKEDPKKIASFKKELEDTYN